jgi:hypothetical protein
MYLRALKANDDSYNNNNNYNNNIDKPRPSKEAKSFSVLPLDVPLVLTAGTKRH